YNTKCYKNFLKIFSGFTLTLPNFALQKTFLIMKQIRLLLLLITLMFGFTNIVAENHSSSGVNRYEKIVLQKSKNHGSIQRPRTPDKQVVTCLYDGTGLALTFVLSEGVANLTITDDSLFESNQVIDTSTLDIYVPTGELSGCITIKLETEKGNIFEGIIEDNIEF
ncbi:MAG: hypothetical protein K2K25_00230, partial [Muribaculaceae bacterium]|nr:hypothetical protein [Muribaculaceae bacterium]